ncbi:MAG: hypothetical protein J07HX5_00633 [halophilic archaeon J07HX5]|nr:MAG: hypothetical protein J07HX5_00633 [halophilic archaeon J07HX5]
MQSNGPPVIDAIPYFIGIVGIAACSCTDIVYRLTAGRIAVRFNSASCTGVMIILIISFVRCPVPWTDLGIINPAANNTMKLCHHGRQ